MTDKALLIQALRQCADRLEDREIEIGGELWRRTTVVAKAQAAESVREYRLLADLCEAKPDAEEKLREACANVVRSCESVGPWDGDDGGVVTFVGLSRRTIHGVRAALALADGAK